jgi:hypothetical protein
MLRFLLAMNCYLRLWTLFLCVLGEGIAYAQSHPKRVVSSKHDWGQVSMMTRLSGEKVQMLMPKMLEVFVGFISPCTWDKLYFCFALFSH